MHLVITDSGLGGLSVCARLMYLLENHAQSGLSNFPPENIKITYVNSVPSDDRGYNSMSGRTEQIETFDKIIRNTTRLLSPDSIFVACGTLSVLLEHMLLPAEKTVKIEGIVPLGVRMLLESLKKKPRSPALIFGTPTTISNKTFQQELLRNGIAEKQIIAQSCPDLASEISNDPEGIKVYESIQHWVKKALLQLQQNISDHLIVFLGCTHYSYRENLFHQAFIQEGFSNITMLNPNHAAAEKLQKSIMDAKQSDQSKKNKFTVDFVTPYEIPEQERITLKNLLNPISPQTSNAFQNARLLPDLLDD